eukprot:10917670-Heterocapsa_arctica.AAC.1
MYSTQVRPDIAYTVKELARHVAGSSQQNMTAIKHLLSGADDEEVTVLADANWADGPSRRSTSGGCVYYLKHLLLTYSRTQP